MVAFVFGVVGAWVWSLNTFVGADLPTRLSGLTPPDSVTGQIVTGILLGAAAGGWHELFDFLSSTAKGMRARVYRGEQG